jgi:hypothetical protein
VQKSAFTILKNATFEFYGIKLPRIVDIASPEIPRVDVRDTSADLVYKLEDDSYLNIEFQTKYNKKDLTRFAEYSVGLFKRDGWRVRTLIVYAADVKKLDFPLNMGDVTFSPIILSMKDYDGDAELAKIEQKVRNGVELEELDILNATLAPMMRSSLPKFDMTARILEVSDHIEDTTRSNLVKGSAISFAQKFLSKLDIKSLLEVNGMASFIEMGVARFGLDKKYKKQNTIEIGKRMISNKIPSYIIADGTGLSEDEIELLELESQD